MTEKRGRPGRVPGGREEVTRIMRLDARFTRKEMARLLSANMYWIDRVTQGNAGLPWNREAAGDWTREDTQWVISRLAELGEVLRQKEAQGEGKDLRKVFNRIWRKIGPVALGMWK